MSKTYRQIVKTMGEMEKTNNIYSSWDETLEFFDKSGFRPLGDFDIGELNHLKWLIEQQIEVLRNKNDV